MEMKMIDDENFLQKFFALNREIFNTVNKETKNWEYHEKSCAMGRISLSILKAYLSSLSSHDKILAKEMLDEFISELNDCLEEKEN